MMATRLFLTRFPMVLERVVVPVVVSNIELVSEAASLFKVEALVCGAEVPGDMFVTDDDVDSAIVHHG